MYNFDKCANRKDVSSLKWMYDDVLPMWVADMDFDTLPEVKEAIKRRCDTFVRPVLTKLLYDPIPYFFNFQII